VHNADLLTAEATISEPWEFHDSWELVMWILAVSAFYYQLCISVGAATTVEKRSYENHLNAMHEWVKVAKAFLAFPTVPVDRQRDALQEIADMVGNIRDTLPLDADALIAEISKTVGLDEPHAS
jgi:hypothetical protein